MPSVRLHVTDSVISALCGCEVCSEVRRYAITQAVAGPVRCKRCGHLMDIRGAVAEAVDRIAMVVR